MIRPVVSQLVAQGVLPSSGSAIPKIEQWQAALEKVKAPLSDEEAAALLDLFPTTEDECYGLAWTLLHLVETAPGWPLQCLNRKQGPWIARLRNAGRLTR
jgi:hypothetical protein